MDEPPKKTTGDALDAYMEARDIDRDDPWYRVVVFGAKVPLFPVRGRLGEALTAHDIHHLVTGYDTSFRGECELAAWELGSGGCNRYVMFWLDRLLFAPLAIGCAPIRFLRAFGRGRHARNLFGEDLAAFLRMDVGAVARWIRKEA